VKDPRLPAVKSLAALADALERRIGKGRYDTWFQGHTQFRVEGHRLVVGVPNLHFQEWLQKRFGADVQATAREVLGKAFTVKFVIDADLFRAARAEQEQAKKDPPPARKPVRPVVELPEPSPRKPADDRRRRKGRSPTPSMFAEPAAEPRAGKPKGATGRRWHDLSDFVVGGCNRVAFAAAQSVIEEPGQGANPLVIHGPVGTGKTHLLEGIFAGLKRRDATQTVRYVTAEEFTNRFVAAMHAGKLGAFRRQFRDCDVLLVDDLHFLARKKATQEEFLHTFDALVAAGKQVVVTTDCHPRLAEELSPELADRLLGGTVWGLQPPDAATRRDILRAKASGPGPAVPDDVIHEIAAKLRGNVRELEGAVRNLRHFAKVLGKPIDKAIAHEALGDLLRHAVRVVRLDEVDAAVCQVLRLPWGTLQSKARSWSVSHPRMIAVYLARKHTAASYSDIGRHFGGRNHSTAVAAEKKVRGWMSGNSSFTGGSKPWRVREIVELAERVLGV